MLTTIFKGISAVVLVFVSAVTGVFHKSDTSTPSVPKNPGIQTTDNNNGYTVEQVPITQVPIPDLDKPIVYKNEIPAEAKDVVDNKFKDLIKALKTDNRNIENWIMLGVFKKTVGDYQGAAEAWEYAKSLSPNDVTAYANLGDLYHFYLKQYDKAEINLSQVTKLMPNNPDGYKALYDLYNLSYKEKASKAPNILLLGLNKLPKSIDLMVALANYYKQQGDKAKAKDYFGKAQMEAKNEGNTALSDNIGKEIDALR